MPLILQVLSKTLSIPENKLTNELTMKDVDSWDSLKHMDLIASLEITFNVEFTFDEIVAMQSIGSIIRILKEKSVAD